MWSVAGSVVFFLIAPGTLAGLLPWWISGWQFAASSPSGTVLEIVGTLLAGTGISVLVDSFARFVWQGLGTPAPIAPPLHLVVSGLYRYTRNPMYLAVLAAIFGQSLLFKNVQLIVYGALVWLGFHLFVRLYEEPTLRKKFGTAYTVYCARVPRWRFQIPNNRLN